MSDLAKNDIDWLERHGFTEICQRYYIKDLSGISLEIYYSLTDNKFVCVVHDHVVLHGEGATAEQAYFDLISKQRQYAEQMNALTEQLESVLNKEQQ